MVETLIYSFIGYLSIGVAISFCVLFAGLVLAGGAASIYAYFVDNDNPIFYSDQHYKL